MLSVFSRGVVFRRIPRSFRGFFPRALLVLVFFLGGFLVEKNFGWDIGGVWRAILDAKSYYFLPKIPTAKSSLQFSLLFLEFFFS